MESIIVHTKNAMELTAVKTMLKEMNIEFEKFHTRNNFHNKKVVEKIKSQKPASARPSKPKGL